MAKTTVVLVKVPDLEGLPSYRRAGLVLTQGENLIEVTDEQLEKLQADARLLVSDAPAKKVEKPKTGEQK